MQPVASAGGIIHQLSLLLGDAPEIFEKRGDCTQNVSVLAFGLGGRNLVEQLLHGKGLCNAPPF